MKTKSAILNVSLSQQKKIIAAAEKFARSIIAHDSGGHDWHHIERVRRMSVKIAEAEKFNPFLPELMALLHELHDRKVAGYGQEQQALQTTRRWLQQQKLPASMVDEVMYVIQNQSYSESGISGKKLTSKAGLIMQDADRLDAIGAIGIGRCFAYVGKKGNAIHDPSIKPRLKKLSRSDYKKDEDTAINHFYEKLLKLKKLINTRTGKKIAAQRHRYMEKFLEEFLAEWNSRR